MAKQSKAPRTKFEKMNTGKSNPTKIGGGVQRNTSKAPAPTPAKSSGSGK